MSTFTGSLLSWGRGLEPGWGLFRGGVKISMGCSHSPHLRFRKERAILPSENFIFNNGAALEPKTGGSMVNQFTRPSLLGSCGFFVVFSFKEKASGRTCVGPIDIFALGYVA
jgi:hypothetical protein